MIDQAQTGGILTQNEMPDEIVAEDIESNKSVEDLIAELRQRTEELEEANRELRRLSHYRSLFLARMSHELRTPLTSILGFSEILLDQEELTETQRRFCQKVQDSGFQLQASLNQLVDLSRLEAGQTELFLQEFTLRETLRESCAAAARMAQKKQVRIEYEIAPEITTIVSDQGKVRQIIFNFIAWVVSRSPIDDTVRITARLDTPSLLQIHLSDNGEPLSEAEHVFDPVGGGAEDPNIDHLGIIIAKRLIELLEGSISVTNKDPQGVDVVFQLPAKPAKDN
ncbi:MAG TPA: HAMP domain-containing sensor histidine kinase [Pyrinomonadaceae bacterium]